MIWLCLSLVLLGDLVVCATETENHGIRILPAQGPVQIDGKFADWDLSGGIFACGDVENMRDQYSVWFHAMYDAQYLYVLARWQDPTPLNNPGSNTGDFGFNGDCLQIRFIFDADTPIERASHWTCWRDRNLHDTMDVAYGRKFEGGGIKDARAEGAQMACQIDADGKGYTQEMAIPWKLLVKDGRPIKPGDTPHLTIEPNFTAGQFGRITIKDIFNSAIEKPDRIFTFSASPHWGITSVLAVAAVVPQPVRLADGRIFPVSMRDRVPVVDWTGVIKKFEWPGFKPISFTMPEDGYISLNICAANGTVVRQLLNAAFYPKGEHTVQWDGLTTPVYRTPGQPASTGVYAWKAIAHPGFHLTLRGWASYGGSAPWENSPTSTWGGDHGLPSACVTDGERMYLAWNGAEGGRHLLATDFQGNVLWGLKNTTGAYDPNIIAVDRGTVYILHQYDARMKQTISRADTKQGIYTYWKGRDSTVLPISAVWEDPAGKADHFLGLDAKNGLLYATTDEVLAVLDGETGKVVRTWPLTGGAFVHAVSDTLVYVVVNGNAVIAIDPTTGRTRTVVQGLQHPWGIASDAAGQLYVSVRDPDEQVQVFTSTGKRLRAIGRRNGRAPLGPFQADGMANPMGVAVDPQGKLWVMESDFFPKRVSVWDVKTGKLLKEFFGPTHYGASGGAINPRDPNVMVGEGCEWRLDPTTGHARCIGVIDRTIHSFANYREGRNSRLYLYTSIGSYGDATLRIFERLGEGKYLRRAEFRPIRAQNHLTGAELWTDANGDGREQPIELQRSDGWLNTCGSNSWSINLGLDGTIFGFNSATNKLMRLPIAGFTPCGAPRYDLTAQEILPDTFTAGYQNNYSCAMPDAENTRLLTIAMGQKDEDTQWRCYDLKTQALLWTYPNPWFQVHGSHHAPVAEPGLFRGAYGPIGIAKLPVVGTVWAINTNLGEWHLLTGDGFYLAHAFQGDVFKWQWPLTAVPGVSMDNVPPGSGQEDFGGSMTQGADGKVYLQSGKNADWNIELQGVEKIVALPGGPLTISDADTRQALLFRERALQAQAATKHYTVKHLTPAFTGKLSDDFAGCEVMQYQKTDDAVVHSTLARDDQHLYLGWEVKDSSPWVNGAKDWGQLYCNGDTVDFQIGADATLDPKRVDATAGDLRLSIGNFLGTPTAVLYRKVSAIKKPRTFTSGVIAGYVMDYVDIVADAQISVKVDPGRGYVVEVAVLLTTLGLAPKDGQILRGDIGVTHGDAAGQRTQLRTYWNNQQTGLVADAVFELQLTPANWGEMQF